MSDDLQDELEEWQEIEADGWDMFEYAEFIH